tara:strand:- start:305 stop:733 length:429 start_codon:yes stop_codon:yes gene_type:complete
MKSFLEYINEDLDGFSGAGLSSTHIPYDIEDPIVKNKINAILGHTAVSEFMNPHAAIAQMESKLSLLGLHKVNSVEGHGEVQEEEMEGSGELDLSFSLHGETIGKSVDTPIDQLDKEEKIVSLKVKYEQLESGSFKVYGSLV